MHRELDQTEFNAWLDWSIGRLIDLQDIQKLPLPFGNIFWWVIFELLFSAYLFSPHLFKLSSSRRSCPVALSFLPHTILFG